MVKQRILSMLIVFSILLSGVTVAEASDSALISGIGISIKNPIIGTNSFECRDGVLTAGISSAGAAARFESISGIDNMDTDYAVLTMNVLLNEYKNPSSVLKLQAEGGSGVNEILITNGYLAIGSKRFKLLENTNTKIQLLLDSSTQSYSLIIGKTVVARDVPADFEVFTDIEKIKGYAYSSDKLSRQNEIRIDYISVSPDKDTFGATEISIDDGSAYIIHDTYEDYPSYKNMVYTGYTWNEPTLTSAVVSVEEKSGSNVMKFHLKERADAAEGELNSIELQSNTHFKGGRNVISNDIFINDNLSKIRFRLRASSTSRVYGMAHIQDNVLYANGNPVMTLELKKWYDISFLLDIRDKYLVFDVLVNDTVVSRGQKLSLSKSKITSENAVFEIYMACDAAVSSRLFLDNYRLYQGDEILPDEYFEKHKYESYFIEKETGPMMKKLEDAVVLATGSPEVKLFSNNSVIDENNRAAVPYLSGNNVMVPLKFMSDAYGYSYNVSNDKIVMSKGSQNVTLSGSDVKINDTSKTLTAPTETVENVVYIHTEDAAYIFGKYAQLTDNGLIIFSSSEKFYDTAENKFEIDMLARLLKNGSAGPKLLSDVDEAFFDDMRAKIALDVEPYKTAWEKTKANADKALKTTYPMYLLGYTNLYYNSALAASAAMRDLAFVYRVTKDETYAARAREILAEWARAENPFPVYRAVTEGAVSEINGLVLSRATTAFLYGYSYLYPYLDSELCRDVELWALRIAAGVKEYEYHWEENDYFGKQYFQNHIVVNMMGITAAGIVAKDLDLLYYVLEDENNPRKVEDLINGCIFMEGDELCQQDPTIRKGAPAVQTGEIYDRYRMNTNRGIQYAELTLRTLTYIVEMFMQYGIDYYSFVGDGGENLSLPYEFYGEFFVTQDSTVKGGYYTGCIMLERYHAVYPIANMRYPENESIRNTCMNVKNLAQSDGEQMGYLASLTHGMITR